MLLWCESRLITIRIELEVPNRDSLGVPREFVPLKRWHRPGVDLTDDFDQQFYPYRPSRNVPATKDNQLAVTVVREPSGDRLLRRMRWGLVAPWAKTDQDPYQQPNVTVEKINTSKTFVSAFQKRRCLVPASGFFEYGPGAAGKRPRYRITVPGCEYFTFAGIYNIFDENLTTMSFVTGPSPEAFAEIHHRMPAILMKADIDRWLDPTTSEAELLAMLTPWAGPWEKDLEPKKPQFASLS